MYKTYELLDTNTICLALHGLSSLIENAKEVLLGLSAKSSYSDDIC